MMRRRFGLSLWLVLAACEPVKLGGTMDPPALAISPDVAVIQLEGGDILAVSRFNGAIHWRYVPPFKARAERDPAPFEPFPNYRVICPMVATQTGDIILRYEDEIMALSANGQRRWSYDGIASSWGRDTLAPCPATTPDSGTVLLVNRGLRLQKLDAKGAIVFITYFGFAGVAIAPPQPLPGSGDILVVTSNHLVNISPEGALNWHVGLADYAFEETPLIIDGHPRAPRAQ